MTFGDASTEYAPTLRHMIIVVVCCIAELGWLLQHNTATQFSLTVHCSIGLSENWKSSCAINLLWSQYFFWYTTSIPVMHVNVKRSWKSWQIFAWKNCRKDLLDLLPVPGRIKTYLNTPFYYSEQVYAPFQSIHKVGNKRVLLLNQRSFKAENQ